MTNKNLLTGLVCTASLLGCAAVAPPPPPPPATPATAGGRAAAVTQCGGSQAPKNTCHRVQPLWNGWVCPIRVTSTPNGTIVEPYHLLVPSGPARIVWHLTDRTHNFRDVDGPNLANNPEFDGGGPTDDAYGDVGNAPVGKKYRILYLNTVASRRHQYTITINTPTGPVSCDPLIGNQSD